MLDLLPRVTVSSWVWSSSCCNFTASCLLAGAEWSRGGGVASRGEAAFCWSFTKKTKQAAWRSFSAEARRLCVAGDCLGMRQQELLLHFTLLDFLFVCGVQTGVKRYSRCSWFFALLFWPTLKQVGWLHRRIQFKNNQADCQSQKDEDENLSVNLGSFTKYLKPGLLVTSV